MSSMDMFISIIIIISASAGHVDAEMQYISRLCRDERFLRFYFVKIVFLRVFSEKTHFNFSKIFLFNHANPA